MEKNIVGYVNFDRFGVKNNILEILVTQDKSKQLRRNKFIKIVDETTGEEIDKYLGRVVEGPFFSPEEVSRDSAFAQISILHGDEIPTPPNFYASYNIEITGQLDIMGKVQSTGKRPSPHSKVFTLSDSEINSILNLGEGNMIMGHIEGYENVLVKFISDKIYVLPRNLGIFGTVGSGKTNTAQVLIEELSKNGWSVIVLDVEGEYTEMNKKNDSSSETDKIKRFDMEAVGIEDFHVLKLCNQDGTIDAEEEVTITTRDLDPYVLGEIIEATEPQMSGLLQVLDDLNKKPVRAREDTEPDFLTPGTRFQNGYTLRDVVDLIDKKIENPKETGVSKASWWPLKRKLHNLLRTEAFDDPSSHPISPSDYMEPGRVTVFDISYTSDHEKNLLTAQLLSKVFDSKIKDRNNSLPRTMIMIEEAHTFISRENKDKMVETMQKVKEIARRGRKRWLGLCFISQQPSHLPSEIFELANTRIVHNIRSKQNLEVLKSSSGDVGEETWDAVPSLSPGSAIVNGPQFRNSVVMKVRFPQSKRRRNE